MLDNQVKALARSKVLNVAEAIKEVSTEETMTRLVLIKGEAALTPNLKTQKGKVRVPLYEVI